MGNNIDDSSRRCLQDWSLFSLNHGPYMSLFREIFEGLRVSTLGLTQRNDSNHKIISNTPLRPHYGTFLG